MSSSRPSSTTPLSRLSGLSSSVCRRLLRFFDSFWLFFPHFLGERDVTPRTTWPNWYRPDSQVLWVVSYEHDDALRGNRGDVP